MDFDPEYIQQNGDVEMGDDESFHSTVSPRTGSTEHYGTVSVRDMIKRYNTAANSKPITPVTRPNQAQYFGLTKPFNIKPALKPVKHCSTCKCEPCKEKNNNKSVHFSEELQTMETGVGEDSEAELSNVGNEVEGNKAENPETPTREPMVQGDDDLYPIETTYQSKTTISRTSSGVRIVIDIFYESEEGPTAEEFASRVETDLPNSRILSEFQENTIARKENPK